MRWNGGGSNRPLNSGEKGRGKGGKTVGAKKKDRIRGRGEFVNRAAHREAGGKRSKEVDGYGKGQQRDRAGKCAVGPCTERGGGAHGGPVRRVRSTGGAPSDGGRRVLKWGCTWNEPEKHGGAVHERTWASAYGAAHRDRFTLGRTFGSREKSAATEPNMKLVIASTAGP